MRAAIVFFLLLFVVFVIYKTFPQIQLHMPLELEQTVNETTQEEDDAQKETQIVTSTMIASSNLPVKEGFEDDAETTNVATELCPQPAEVPGKLPTARIGSLSDNAPRPAFDPALQPTTTARILTTLDALNGFMNFEAEQLENRSDPQVQLPLSTLKADIETLTNESLTLQRNPGLRPSFTQLQMQEIEANLDFLQRQARTFEVEGFQVEGF